MTDREKAIKGLECCTDGFMMCKRERCPYYGKAPIDSTCRIELEKDAIALLKEQEPREIIRKYGKRENPDGYTEYFAEWYCPHCGKLLNRGYSTPWIEFCYKCGGAVKWDG